MIIAVDAMGGDTAPSAEVHGALWAARESAVRVLLVGDEPRLRALLGAGDPRVTIRHASQVVTMDDHPAQAYRAKRESSLRVAFDAVKSGEAAAVVSAGNSGAILTHGVFVLGRLDGVERPAIATVFPTPAGPLTLCDVGANVDVKPQMLAQFALLGAAYDRVAHKRPRPRVGLLSNGGEAGKGTELTRAAHALLAALPASAPMRYLGYVEGSDLFRGMVDVVATDGFTGNVVLKTMEGTAGFLLGEVRAAVGSTLPGRLGGLMVRPALRRMRERIDPESYGGAVLLGVRGLAVIGHGNATGRGVANAVRLAAHGTRERLAAHFGEALAHEGAERSPAA